MSNDMEPLTYHIYGRKTYANPLKFVGVLTLDAEPSPQDEQLRSETLKHFGNEEWVELVALPSTDLLYIIQKAGSV